MDTINDINWDDVHLAFSKAKRLISRVQTQTSQMAKIVADSNMRKIDDSTLRKLKKKLSKYNMHTQTWKD